MSTDSIITELNAFEAIAFLSSNVGQQAWEGVCYFTQQSASDPSFRISRCNTNTWIAIDKITFCFRHWREGVAGMVISQEGKGNEAYALIDSQWVNLD